MEDLACSVSQKELFPSFSRLSLTSLKVSLGTVCTFVVTEFHRAKPGQTSAYLIEASFVSSSEVEEMLQNYLENFRFWYLMSEKKKRKLRTDQIYFAKLQATKSFEVLNSIFSEKPEFTDEFLKRGSKNAFRSILDKLVEWTLATTGHPANRWGDLHFVEITDDHAQYRDIIRMLQGKKTKSTKKVMWPFISSIR